MLRLFLIFERSTGHPVVFLGSAEGPLEAIVAFLREHVEVAPDGGVSFEYEGERISYPHPLAYIEANIKIHGEWQIREVPEGGVEARLTEAFCGEDPSDVEFHLEACRKLLKTDEVKEDPAGFIWYLRDGVLVTFYRPAFPFKIDVLQRYVRRWSRPTEYLPWTGTYSDLLNDLYLGPGRLGILQP